MAKISCKEKFFILNFEEFDSSLWGWRLSFWRLLRKKLYKIKIASRVMFEFSCIIQSQVIFLELGMNFRSQTSFLTKAKYVDGCEKLVMAKMPYLSQSKFQDFEIVSFENKKETCPFDIRQTNPYLSNQPILIFSHQYNTSLNSSRK